MEQRVGFASTLNDVSTGQPVEVQLWGTAQAHGNEADPQAGARVQAAVQQATEQVLGQALQNQQVAMPTLSVSLAHFVPQIVHAANQSLGPAGMQLTGLELQCTVPEHAIAPAAAAIAAAPSPLESVASNFASNVADEVASSVPNRLNVNVGGFKVGVGADGVDGGSLADQAADKVKSNVIHYAIVGAVLLLVCFCCCGAIGYKLLFP